MYERGSFNRFLRDFTFLYSKFSFLGITSIAFFSFFFCDLYLFYIKFSPFILNHLGQLAAFRWRSKFGRPSKVPSLGDVDPTGSYCAVPDDWLLRKYGTIINIYISRTSRRSSDKFFYEKYLIVSD